MSLSLSIVPEKALVARRGDTILAASWFGAWTRRPYIYPFRGPKGVELTRLGHPEDPVGHSHHRSIWIGHRDVAGVDFWGESPDSGQIVQTAIKIGSASGPRVDAELELSWRDAKGKEILLETRRLVFSDLPGEELALDVDMLLRTPGEDLTLGKSSFGILGLRVASTIRVHARLGGLIFNSQEGENESGCMGQHAVWCDYSGPVPLVAKDDTPLAGPGPHRISAVTAGLACFVHPDNDTKEETAWHVRDDGWIGPGLTRMRPRNVTRERPLRVRYRLEAHAGRPWEAGIDDRYRRWRRGE
jgi:hypothetical protein